MRVFFQMIVNALFILSSCNIVSSASQERGCITTCCKDCSVEPICSLCRRLHADREGCKCVSEFEETIRNLHGGDRLSQMRESALDADELHGVQASSEAPDVSTTSVPKCRPSCCPRPDCTKLTCPSCYAKMRRVPSLCPCVNIEEEGPHLSQHQSHNDVREDNLSSVQNILTDIREEDDGVTSVSVTTPRPVPLCRPSCCPRADCTKLTCPGCYARLRRTPDLCPCVNTGQLQMKH